LKILITGGKSALALKVLKAFAQHDVVLADYDEVPSFSAGNYKFISIGEKNEDTIAHLLLNSCLDEGVDAILPLQVFEILPVAKAQILFAEFSIRLLLPKIEELELYFNAEGSVKMKDWVVYIDGNILFATNSHVGLITLGKERSLHGIYYFNHEEPVANLQLFTI
jgi:hypothetical protein